MRGQKFPFAIETAETKPFCRLLRFRYALAELSSDPKVPVVAPLSGRHATLVCDAVRSLRAGHDV